MVFEIPKPEVGKHEGGEDNTGLRQRFPTKMNDAVKAEISSPNSVLKEQNGIATANGMLELDAAQNLPEDVAWIKLFTLNCWGLKFVAKNRKERFEAIAARLLDCDYDVVFFQEVWLNSDYHEFVERLKPKYPFSHYFDHGIIGSGTCIFSTTRLQEANFHQFPINGYPTNFWHGDWFAAKGIGVCQINFKGYDIHLYVSHYHANYNPKNDIYLSHRVNHAFESASWIKLASSAADLTIYAGDLNSEPYSLPYRLLRAIAPLRDCYEDTHSQELEDNGGRGGETSETEGNSYTSPNDSNRGNGHRIDYIMYTPGPCIIARTKECNLPFPSRVPGRNFSYSDHEGVAATIEISRKSMPILQNQSQSVLYRRMISMRLRHDCVGCVTEAITVMERAIKAVDWYQFKYCLLTAILCGLLILTFLPAVLVPPESPYHFGFIDLALFFPRFLLTAAFVIFCMMATFFSKLERNALIGSKKHLQLLLEQDVESKQ